MQKRIFNCSTILFLFIIFLFPGNFFAQLSGTKTIPGDYATIEAAIAALNLQGVGPGGVTFNVAAGHTETFTSPTAGLISATGTQPNQILFQKRGVGNNPKIIAGVGTGTLDAIVVITGGDYITFDGIDLSENSANTDNTTRMEWGFTLLKRNILAPADGCYFVTLKNSMITLDKQNTSTWGIYAANHTVTSTTSSTMTDSLDVMSYCKFYNNSITNSYNGIRIISATTAGFYGQNNEVGVGGGNNISNFGDGSVTAYGMNLEYQNKLKVANNAVNGGGSSQTGIMYGIRTGSGTNSNVDIYNNSVTVTQSGTSLIYAITNSMGSSGIDNTVNIYNNTVENCLHSGSTSNSVWLIYNLASAYNLNIYGNRVRNNTKSAGTGPVHCIYNSPTTATVNAQIYNNEIYNNSSAGPMNGIHITAGTNTSIYGNKIYDLRTTSSSTYVTSGILVASGPINTYIYNNFISDLKASNSAEVNAVRGISITSTTANSNIGLYYNTIFLNALSGGSNFGTTGIYHTNSATATTAALDMRDNVVVNLSTPNGTGKTVAFRRSAANVNLNNYSTTSNNNCFYAGTPGVNNVIFFDGTNFDQTIEEFKTRVAPRETFSFTENVPFENVLTPPYNLHVKTNVSTQTESGGTPITTPIVITNDFDGQLRNATTPDVGADEFNGIGTDITAPSIAYTSLDHTTSTANRLLSNVTIVDQSGVNVTPGTAPRIYYKRSSDINTFFDNTSSTNGWKYTETSNTTSPFEFLINYALLFGGTGVQSGDTIQYFVIAQDLFNPPNVGISEGTFASTPASVNLTPAAFPITGTINFYRIILLLNGSVTVGTGGNYPSLTGPNGLFTTINGNIVSGNLVAQIISDISEPGTNALNQWVEDIVGSNYTLTIQPNSAVNRTLSGTYKGGLFRLNGADRVIIDGRFNSAGNYLTFVNNKDTNNTATIQLISLGSGQGCTDVTIRNTNIKSGTNTVSNVFGICVAGTTLTTGSSGGADLHNISIIENKISKTRLGIFTRGTSTSLMNNLLITGNIIGSDLADEYVTEYGIYPQSANAPQITYNEVFNMIYDVSKWAIYFGTYINNAFVSKNKIHSIKQPGTTGYNSVGIYFNSATGCFDNQIDNNMIYDLSTYGNTSMYLVGIRIAGGSGYKVYYNSVSISDSIGNPASGLVSSCLYLSAAAANIDIRNNIFSNTRLGGTSPKNYAVHSPNTTTFLQIDNNDYWTTGNVLGYFGADVLTFNDWQVATGQDSNSISDDPHFISDTDLHINSSFSTVCDIGVPIVSVTTDIDGDLRSATTPDIGADEYNCGGTTFAFSVTVTNGWNMVSVPGINPGGMGVNIWWSFRDPGTNVFKYSGGYQSVTEVVPGTGYWMKHLGDHVYSYSDVQIVPHDPIAGASGWNLFGGYELSVTATNVTTNPPGQQSGPIYKYSGGYQVATTLDPGYGYWIKLLNAAQIIIPETLAKGEATVEYFPENWGKIVLTDATGINYTLYAVKSETDLSQYELPPAPMAGMFDIRFSSGRIAEDLNSAIKTIEMSGVTYPLTVRVENMDIRLMDETGKTVNVNLKSGEEITISDATIQKLMVSGELIPAAYALEQNYPNPFNPSTVIEFSLPENVGNVKLSIYNTLGEKVAELVNTALTAGKYQYQWNAKNVATGMYIYELRTDKFVSVKKMLMIK